jgi:hypothetical protein
MFYISRKGHNYKENKVCIMKSKSCRTIGVPGWKIWARIMMWGRSHFLMTASHLQMQKWTINSLEVCIVRLTPSCSEEYREPPWTARKKVDVKLSLCLTTDHSMKKYWWSGGIAARILHHGSVGGEWSASRPGRFTPRERDWVGSRTVLDAVVKRKIPHPRRESNPRTPIV